LDKVKEIGKIEDAKEFVAQLKSYINSLSFTSDYQPLGIIRSLFITTNTIPTLTPLKKTTVSYAGVKF